MAGQFDDSMISRIQEATDIVDVISEHLSLQRKGKEFVGLCPFHQDHRPSMFVSPVKQIFKCFACGAGGDVFKFIQLRENVEFPEAVRRLADRAGIRLDPEPQRKRQDGNNQIDSRQLAKVNEWALKFWQRNLKDEQLGSDARSYVCQRNISDQSRDQWRLGLAADRWDGLLSAASQRNIPVRLLVAAGLVVERDDGSCFDKFRNRLMFPIHDVTGRVIGFGGRTLGDDPAKYMNSPTTALFDKSNHVYGLDKARHEIGTTDTAVVVEGYTDVMMAHQYGCCNVVAALGTSFTDGHARLLRRYAKRIVLIFDNDVAGVEAANRALEVCLSQKIDISLGFVEEGKDPCDYFISHGADAFRNLVENAVDVMKFKWDRLIEGLDKSDNTGDRREVIEEYFRAIVSAIHSRGSDPIAEGLINTKLRQITGMSEDSIRRELARLSKKSNRNSQASVKNRKVLSVDLGKGYFARAQREVLEVLLNVPELFEGIKDKIKAEQFDVAAYREIAGELFEILENEGEFEIKMLTWRIESTDTVSLAVDLQFEGESKGNYEQRLQEAAEAFRVHRKEERKRKIRAGLGEDDMERLKEFSKMLGKKNSRNPGMRIG